MQGSTPTKSRNHENVGDFDRLRFNISRDQYAPLPQQGANEALFGGVMGECDQEVIDSPGAFDLNGLAILPGDAVKYPRMQSAGT